MSRTRASFLCCGAGESVWNSEPRSGEEAVWDSELRSGEEAVWNSGPQSALLS